VSLVHSFIGAALVAADMRICRPGLERRRQNGDSGRLIAWVCFRTLSSVTATAEEKKWAMSVLSAASGDTIGYLVRK
jgi:hypothetical protein